MWFQGLELGTIPLLGTGETLKDVFIRLTCYATCPMEQAEIQQQKHTLKSLI